MKRYFSEKDKWMSNTPINVFIINYQGSQNVIRYDHLTPVTLAKLKAICVGRDVLK